MTFATDARLLADINIVITPFEVDVGDILTLTEGRYLVRCALGDRSYSVRRLTWCDELLLKLGVKCDPAPDSDLPN